jgi:hypothetical protein
MLSKWLTSGVIFNKILTPTGKNAQTDPLKTHENDPSKTLETDPLKTE